MKEETRNRVRCSRRILQGQPVVSALYFGIFLLVASPSCLALSGGGLGGVFAAIFTFGFFTFAAFSIIKDWRKRRQNKEAPEKIGGIRGFFSDLPAYAWLALFFCLPILFLYGLIGIGDTPLQTFFLSWVTAIIGIYFFRHT